MSADGAPTVKELADLVAELRRITALGPAADPDERASFLAAKREILARISEADQ